MVKKRSKAEDLNLDDLADTGRVCACFNIRKASRAITQLYDEHLAPAGIRATQYSLLLSVHFGGELGIGPISEYLVTDRTTLTRNLKPLLKRGLIERATHPDKRTRAYRLTKKGESTLKAAHPLWKKAQKKVRDALGTERLETLRATVDKVVALTTD